MRIALFGLLLIAASTVSASGGDALDIKGKPFAEQEKAIRAQLATDEYREISAEDRGLVTSALERMGERIEAAGSVENLPPQAMVDVFNDQESVNAILTKAREDSRRVCKRVKKTGSNFTTNYCRTVAQMRREAEAARDYVRRSTPSVDNSMQR